MEDAEQNQRYLSVVSKMQSRIKDTTTNGKQLKKKKKEEPRFQRCSTNMIKKKKLKERMHFFLFGQR